MMRTILFRCFTVMSKFRYGVENGLFKVCFVLTCDWCSVLVGLLVFFKLVHVLTCVVVACLDLSAEMTLY